MLEPLPLHHPSGGVPSRWEIRGVKIKDLICSTTLRGETPLKAQSVRPISHTQNYRRLKYSHQAALARRSAIHTAIPPSPYDTLPVDQIT